MNLHHRIVFPLYTTDNHDLHHNLSALPHHHLNAWVPVRQDGRCQRFLLWLFYHCSPATRSTGSKRLLPHDVDSAACCMCGLCGMPGLQPRVWEGCGPTSPIRKEAVANKWPMPREAIRRANVSAIYLPRWSHRFMALTSISTQIYSSMVSRLSRRGPEACELAPSPPVGHPYGGQRPMSCSAHLQ